MLVIGQVCWLLAKYVGYWPSMLVQGILFFFFFVSCIKYYTGILSKEDTQRDTLHRHPTPQNTQTWLLFYRRVFLCVFDKLLHSLIKQTRCVLRCVARKVRDIYRCLQRRGDGKEKNINRLYFFKECVDLFPFFTQQYNLARLNRSRLILARFFSRLTLARFFRV